MKRQIPRCYCTWILYFKERFLQLHYKDVLVLAAATSNQHTDKQIWLNYGVAEHKKILAVHEIRIVFGSEKATVLFVFHAFTGCDIFQTSWEKDNMGKMDIIQQCYRNIQKRSRGYRQGDKMPSRMVCHPLV